MSIEGRIAVDVSFADKSDGSGVQSLKKISLTDTASYTTGKVAVVTGTVGVSTVAVSLSSVAYRESSGALVSFAALTRAALKGSSAVSLSHNGVVLLSSNGGVSIRDMDALSGTLTLASPGPTANYTLVLYGT